MGCCEDGMSSSRGFLRFPGFLVLHLGYAYAVRIHREALGKQVAHGNASAWIIAFVSDEMYNVIECVSVLIPLDKIKLTH